jgi:hypothetical protein
MIVAGQITINEAESISRIGPTNNGAGSELDVQQAGACPLARGWATFAHGGADVGPIQYWTPNSWNKDSRSHRSAGSRWNRGCQYCFNA